MTKRFLLFLSLTLSISQSYAQHWGIKPGPQELTYRAAHIKASESMSKLTSDWIMPSDARFPGEFEESQAVAIAWVYDYTNITDVDVTSDYASLWGDMANAIQKECTVWIRVLADNDSNKVKQFMSGKGTPLTNCRFFTMVGDDIWTRDYGPLGFYYSGDDSVGFLDMNYYPGRDNDNLFPQLLAGRMNYKNVKTNLYAEGGNFITDGFGTSFHSNVIPGENDYATPAHTAWSGQQIKDTIQYAWGSKRVVETVKLGCDGGTGHNDMFMKMMDEQTFVFMEYPAIVTASDKNVILNSINLITQTQSVYNRPYRIFKMPMPTNDIGGIPTTCTKINDDARTYVNGLTVNKTYIMPSFSNSSSGNAKGDDSAVKLFQKIAPGYKIVPLDARLLTVGGGAIHCVTMQIPAENPIRFWHPPITDLQPLLNNYHIIANISNKSGIASAICNWRVQGVPTWNTINLSDSSGYKIGDIIGAFAKTDIIEYYLSATSNNGKTMTKPIVAPSGGYYSFYFQYPEGVNGLDPQSNFLLNPLPNPTTGAFIIPVSSDRQMQIKAQVVDVMGRKISSIDFGKEAAGMTQLEFDLSEHPAGMYFIQVFANDRLLGSKRVLKQ